MTMNQKIAQHRHCRSCGKAFVGDDKYCSEDCEKGNEETMRKKQRQLLTLYVISVIIMIGALVLSVL
jgi:predicted nucleic acid-binding Zn ribbon protein